MTPLYALARMLLSKTVAVFLIAFLVMAGQALAREESPFKDMKEAELMGVIKSPNYSGAQKIDALYQIQKLPEVRPETIDAVVEVLVSRDPDNTNIVRSTTLEVFRKHPKASLRAVPVLMSTAKEADWFMRYSSLLALMEIAPADAAVYKLFLDSAKDANETVRSMAMRGIARVPDNLETGLPYLKAALKDSHQDVRYEAIRSLADLAEDGGRAADVYTLLPEIIIILDDVYDMSRGYAAHTIGALGDAGKDVSEALPDVIKLLEDKESFSLKGALYAIRYFGAMAAPAVPRIIELSSASDYFTRAAAKQALKAIGTKEAQAALRNIKNVD